MTEIEKLIQWMAEHHITHLQLARQMKWSPHVVLGALTGAWSLSDSFRWTFAKVYGFDVAGQIFDHKAPPAASVSAS